jgi:hypothetical protein
MYDTWSILWGATGAALTTKLAVPHNIAIVPLPPKCAELSPQENVWQFLRDNWLSNRVFDNTDALIDHCCDAWNKLEAQPWTIMFIDMRDWAPSVLISESWYKRLHRPICDRPRGRETSDRRSHRHLRIAAGHRS